MRTISIQNKFIKKFCEEGQAFEMASTDSLISFTPGEWVEYSNAKGVVFGVGFVNPTIQSGPCFSLVDHRGIKFKSEEDLLEKKIVRAINYRNKFKNYGENSRLVYGYSDYLPGLIIDSYVNCIIIQINSAGIDKHRKTINKVLGEHYPDKKLHFLDNEAYRQNENLPSIKDEKSVNLPDEILVLEEGITFGISKERIQKVGYYYDHRENRRKLHDFLTRSNKDINTGLDLFCYVGSWGLIAMKAGVKEMTFVDQANFESEVKNTLSRSSLDGSVEFEHSDVFKFLEKDNKKYDLIISDPPAFSKSAKNIKNAIRGYQKLYRSIFPKLKYGSYLVVASCTHGVFAEDLDEIINNIAFDEKRRVKLLDLGIQGHDHIMNSFKSKSNYIKYLLYYVE